MSVAEEFENILKTGRTILNVQESKRILEIVGFPINQSFFSHSCEEALESAKDIGFPCVLKLVSPEIIHKTEVGGVSVVYSSEEVISLCNKMTKNVLDLFPDARIKGYLVEEMITEGFEVIIGGIDDQSFGKTLMFGIGGIFVELYKDVSFRLIPIDKRDAEMMIRELRGAKIFDGYRGKPKVNQEALVDLLLKTSNLIVDYPIIKEIDLNPVFISDTATVVDARIVLSNT